MATVCDDIIDKITLHPRSEAKTVSINPELHRLVEKKILQQDEEIRKALKLFEYNLDQTMVDMLFVAKRWSRCTILLFFYRE